MVTQNVAQQVSDAKSQADHMTLMYLAKLQDEQMTELKSQSQILEFLKKLKNPKFSGVSCCVEMLSIVSWATREFA
jgi:ferritin